MFHFLFFCSQIWKWSHFSKLFTISNNLLVFNFVPFFIHKNCLCFWKFVPIINFLFSKFYKCLGFKKMFTNFKNHSVEKCSRLLFYFLKFENSSELLIFLIVFWYTARLLKEIHNFKGKFGKIQKKLSRFFIGISSYTSTLHI